MEVISYTYIVCIIIVIILFNVHCLQIFPDNSYNDDWPIPNDSVSKLMHSDSFTATSNVFLGAKRCRSSTGDVELVQKDISTVVELLPDNVITKESLLLPVKLEPIGTPSSIDSTEEAGLHSITMVTQERTTKDDIINLDTSKVANDNTLNVANGNSELSEC